MTTDQTASGAARRPRKGRSPSYPAISLRAAVERAQVIWDNERHHEAPIAAITGHWGFRSPDTGPASVTYAALRKFGLLDVEGTGASRVAKLTPLAIDILMKPDSLPAIRQAALTPPIHRETWEKYGANLPSEANLRYRFVVEGGFTDTGFQEFIREYRDTIDYAQLASAGSLDGETDASGGQDDDHEGETQPADLPPPPFPKRRQGGVSGNVLTIPVPIIGGKPVTVEGEFPISEAAWAQFMAVLNAMKPGLVRDPELDKPDERTD